MRFVLVLAAVAVAFLVWRSRHGPEVWHALDEHSGGPHTQEGQKQRV